VAPDFRKQIAPGDVVVAGRNFGCGSSREHAPKALKFAGVSAVVADAFARIFFRNALNIGLLAIPVPGISGETATGDVLEIDVYQGQIVNLTRGRRHAFVPYDDFILEMIEAGGIVQQTIQMLKEGRLP
jgi:3-isopropylmalate/(R)-2-methylmalate dehydratase small subunit